METASATGSHRKSQQMSSVVPHNIFFYCMVKGISNSVRQVHPYCMTFRLQFEIWCRVSIGITVATFNTHSLLRGSTVGGPCRGLWDSHHSHPGEMWPQPRLQAGGQLQLLSRLSVLHGRWSWLHRFSHRHGPSLQEGQLLKAWRGSVSIKGCRPVSAVFDSTLIQPVTCHYLWSHTFFNETTLKGMFTQITSYLWSLIVAYFLGSDKMLYNNVGGLSLCNLKLPLQKSHLPKWQIHWFW